MATVEVKMGVSNSPRRFAENMLKVSEIFHSYQGEGKNIGMPAVFLRLAICNLKCHWCDTPYTWNWTAFDRDKEIHEMEVSDILSVIETFDCKNLVLTGGEPMLQQKELLPLLQLLKEKGFWIEVETNGTIKPKNDFDLQTDRYNCSPKLSSSGSFSLSDTAPFFFTSVKALFKFVICGEPDLKEVVDFVREQRILPGQVYLMPEGRTSAELLAKEVWVVRAAKAASFHFTTRRHILEFGNRRGV